MIDFLTAWLDWGWAWMLVGLLGHVVVVAITGACDG